MSRRCRWLKYALVAVVCLAGLALAGFAQREVILTRVVGDGYLHGSVVDEQGQPVGGVPVVLVAQRNSGINCSSGQCDLFNAPVVTPRAVTDAQGNFTLHMPRMFLAERGRPGLLIYKLQVQVTASKIKFFYKLNLAAYESTQQTFKVGPPFLITSGTT